MQQLTLKMVSEKSWRDPASIGLPLPREELHRRRMMALNRARMRILQDECEFLKRDDVPKRVQREWIRSNRKWNGGKRRK